MLYISFLSSIFLGWLSSRQAARKGRNHNIWFFLGFFFGFFGFLVIYFLPSHMKKKEPETPAIPGNWYYLDENDVQHGPMSHAKLLEQKIDQTTLVWSESLENWIPLDEATKKLL